MIWDKKYNKKDKEELQKYLQFKKRGYTVPNKKKYKRRDKHHKEDVQW